MGKVVFISGASSGIGYEAAVQLQGRGYKVIASVRNNEDKLRLNEVGIDNVVSLDLADTISVQAAAKEILTLSQGKLFAVFNNGAYGQPGAVEDLTRDTLRKQFEVNLFGTHELTCLLLPELLQQKDARIIQNSSILGFISMPMRGAYNASKHALEGLSETLRIELRETSVQVAIIQPGPILTKFRENALKALDKNVDFTTSRHQSRYQEALERLSKPGPASKHTLGPDVVVKALLHALEAKRAKSHYRVTFPTKLMRYLKPILPTALMDKILLGAAESRSG